MYGRNCHWVDVTPRSTDMSCRLTPQGLEDSTLRDTIQRLGALALLLSSWPSRLSWIRHDCCLCLKSIGLDSTLFGDPPSLPEMRFQNLLLFSPPTFLCIFCWCGYWVISPDSKLVSALLISGCVKASVLTSYDDKVNQPGTELCLSAQHPGRIPRGA